MNVLLDEDMPHPFRHHLPGHDVWTVDYMGWKGTVNGALFALARDDFDVLVTLDQKIPHQQNPTELDVAVIILIAGRGRIEDLIPLASQVLEVMPRSESRADSSPQARQRTRISVIFDKEAPYDIG